jgi:RNA polymerase sigma-70 factor, ECF subfamily
LNLNDDKQTFSKVAIGDKASFDLLFKKYYAQLVRFAIGYVHEGQLAEEIVQDVFIKIWENSSKISIESSVLAYLYTSVRNAALNFIKHEKTQKKYEKEEAEIPKTEDTPLEEKVDMNFFRTILSKALSNLPDKCREIFEMAKFEGLSYDEIAEYLEVSEKTVENQMGIALRKLRDSMIPYMNRIYNG